MKINFGGLNKIFFFLAMGFALVFPKNYEIAQILLLFSVSSSLIGILDKLNEK